MKIRFLNPGEVPPEYGAAADAAIFKEVSEERSPPTLLIYSRNRPTVSLGRFRNPEEDIRTELIEESDVSVVRRISGGSSVLTGTSQLVYSLTIKDVYKNRSESYFEICKCVRSAVESLGIDTVFKEPNDILANGRKISGSAQYRAKGFLLQHGTIIIEPEPLLDIILKPVKDRSYPGTTSLSECLNRNVSKHEIIPALRESFEKGLEAELYDGSFTETEKEFISSVREEFKVSVSGLSDP
jgi:lipoate-protein ligase A